MVLRMLLDKPLSVAIAAWNISVTRKFKMINGQGWRQEFSYGGLTLPTRGLKYGFQSTINAKYLRKNRFSPSDGGTSMLRRGL